MATEVQLDVTGSSSGKLQVVSLAASIPSAVISLHACYGAVVNVAAVWTILMAKNGPNDASPL